MITIFITQFFPHISEFLKKKPDTLKAFLADVDWAIQE